MDLSISVNINSVDGNILSYFHYYNIFHYLYLIIFPATPKGSVNLREQFKAFSKFGDTKSDGRLLTLSQSDKWMKQAKVVDNKTISTTDTAITFKKFKSVSPPPPPNKINHLQKIQVSLLLPKKKKSPSKNSSQSPPKKKKSPSKNSSQSPPPKKKLHSKNSSQSPPPPQ